MFSSPRTSRRGAGPRYAVPAAIASLSLVLAACGGGSDAGGTAGAPAKDALSKASGVTTVSFWHSMDGKNAEELTKLVTEFNQKNSGKIEVKATYAGKYDDAITKYKAAIQSKSTPDVIQIYDIGTRFMIDAKQTVPMQSFIDRDKLDVSDLQPNITGYYSVDNKLHSMPFNTSMPVHVLQQDALQEGRTRPREAAQDDRRRSAPQPRSCPRRTAARPTTASARPSTAGCSSSSSPPSGEEYCDKGNGREDKATKVMFDQREALEVVSWWQKMVKDGLAANTGRDTKAAQAAFKSGQAAITLESTGQLGGFTKAFKEAGWELGAANYPQVKAGDDRARSSVAPRCGSTASATRTPTRRPPGSS